MKQKISRILLFIYHNILHSNVVRSTVKKCIGHDKIKIQFNDFTMYAGVDSAIESNIIFKEYNEIKVLKIIRNYAEKKYHFIDIGANIGVHSLTAAKANSEIEIFSFEPEPCNYLNFIKNISLNGFLNIRPFRLGVGNFNGNTALHINEGWNKGKHSLKMNFKEGGLKVNIPVIKLNDFKENLNFNQSIVKIDVEGFEKEVIEGAQEVFSTIANMVLIIELVTEINGQENCIAITSDLTKIGFEKIYKIDVNHQFCEVNSFDGSADYVFLKGQHAIQNFSNI